MKGAWSALRDNILEFYTPSNISGTAKAREFKFCTLVGRVKYYPMHQEHVTKFCTLVGRVKYYPMHQEHMTHLRLLHPVKYLRNGIWCCSWTLQFSYTSWLRKVLVLWCLTVPQVGVVTWPMPTFWVPGNIFGADEARHFKFGLWIERKEYWHYTCKSSAVWVHLGSLTS